MCIRDSNWAMWFNTKGVNQYWAYTTGGGNSTYAGFSAYPAGGYSASNAHILVPYTWNHCVFQNTGGYENWYLNGTRIYNTQNNPSLSASATGARMGNSPAYSSYFYYGGYMSDLRVTTGNNYNPYSNASTLTVPTAPLTSGSYTRLLLNGTNAAMIDQSQNNNIETVGNAQLDTAVKKFGTASAQWTGTGAYLRLNQSLEPDLIPVGGGDFTIEFQLRLTDVTSTQVFIDFRHNSVSNIAPVIYISSGFKFYAGTSEITIGTLSTNTWHHIALVRNGSTITSYIDGTAGGTESNTNDLTTEIKKLEIETLDNLKLSKAKNTIRAYKSDFSDFALFCSKHGMKSMPTEPKIVSLYLTHLSKNSKFSTLKRRLASINVMHKYKGHYLDTKHPIIVENLLGIKRQIGIHQKAKKPLLFLSLIHI